jgi:hypothetical protein
LRHELRQWKRRLQRKALREVQRKETL